MNIRFYIDPDIGYPHIYKHGVEEYEVEDVLLDSGEDRPGREGSRIAIGRTSGGRYLRVIYVPDPEPGHVFVVTAYELRGNPLAAYRRRMRRRGEMKPVNRFPEGWDEERVHRVLHHYESQTEDEALEEDEVALEDSGQTLMKIPNELVGPVRALLSQHAK